MYSNNDLNVPTRILCSPLVARFFGNQACAGFPSPADDLGAQRIDLTQVLITHPQATYFLRARGHSMIDAGILDKDILVVDRAVKPKHNHVVVAIVDGDLTVKYLYQRAGRMKLKSANPTFPDILPKEGKRWKCGAWSRAPSNSFRCDGFGLLSLCPFNVCSLNTSQHVRPC